MWTREQSIETSASAAVLWRLWSDVGSWSTWNGDIEQIEISGPFARGSTITMTPIGEEPIELLIAEANEPDLFIDEALIGELRVRTVHSVEPADGGANRVLYRMEISGPDADSAGARIGEQISADFPATLSALVRRAESR